MRFARFLAILLLAAAAIGTPVSAQDECSVASPCPWVVEVGPSGFVDQADWNRSLGETFTFEIANTDEVAHTVTLEGYGITLTIPGDDARETTFTLDKAGRFTLRDQPSGDEGFLTVVDGDVVDYEAGLIDEQGEDISETTSGKAGMPSLGLPLVLGALAIAALGTRRF